MNILGRPPLSLLLRRGLHKEEHFHTSRVRTFKPALFEEFRTGADNGERNYTLDPYLRPPQTSGLIS